MHLARANKETKIIFLFQCKTNPNHPVKNSFEFSLSLWYNYNISSVVLHVKSRISNPRHRV